MLIIFFRAVIIYVCLFVLMRLMGKRQLSELQPFEFVITLILADLACVPMSDLAIPLAYGLVPIFSVFLLHVLLTLVSVKSIKLRKTLNGSPQVVISRGSICADSLQKLGMHTDDLLEGLRSKGFFSPLSVEYAIIETNGTMSVLPKSHSRPLTPSDMSISARAPSVPVSIITEGRLIRQNILNIGLNENKINAFLNEHALKQKDVMLMTLDNEKNIYLQPYKQDFKTMLFE